MKHTHNEDWRRFDCPACIAENLSQAEKQALEQRAIVEDQAHERAVTGRILELLKTKSGKTIHVPYEPRANHEGGYGHRQEVKAMLARIDELDAKAREELRPAKWWEFWR